MNNSSRANWVEGYRRYLYFLATRHLCDGLAGQSASDVVQDAMARAVEKVDQCRATNEPQRRGWLRQILLNKIRERRRSNGPKALHAIQQLEEDVDRSSIGIEHLVATCQSSVGAGVVRCEQLERMIDALERLPPHQRRAVELRHLNQLPIAKVAELMETTIPSVAGLVRRGLEQLRRDLAVQSESQSQ